jgi:hypothetical protein
VSVGFNQRIEIMPCVIAEALSRLSYEIVIDIGRPESGQTLFWRPENFGVLNRFLDFYIVDIHLPPRPARY